MSIRNTCQKTKIRKISGTTKEKEGNVDRVRLPLTESQIKTRERRALRAFRKMPTEAQERITNKRREERTREKRRANFQRTYGNWTDHP